MIKSTLTRSRRRISPPVTPVMAAQIKRLHMETDLVQHQIAAMFGVNQGRISEVLTGKLHPDVPPAP